MPFSEKIKREVKQKAAFRCCRYQNIGIDIHHIIPESDEGFISITYFGKISHTKEGGGKTCLLHLKQKIFAGFEI